MTGIALCYVRKSLVLNATDEISPERQRTNIFREAEERGFIAELYEDAQGHRSGRTENRPGWQLLKVQLERPEVKAVIVESLSRASRSIRDLFNFVHELEQRDISLISLKEKIDTSTAMGRAFLGVIAVLNQFESDVASERAAMNIEFLQQVKGRHWGTTVFGCERAPDDHRLIPSTEGVWWMTNGLMAVGRKDAPPFRTGADAEWRGYHGALLRCYEIYVENRLGYMKIDDRLNAEGYRYRTRRGMPRPFDKDDVRRMIAAHLIYAGRVVLGRCKDGVTDSVKGSHAAIVPAELCVRVAALQKERHGRWAKGGGGRPKYVYLFRSLHCADCGSHLTGQFQRGRRWYRHYDAAIKCLSSKRVILADDIEAQLWDHLDGFRSPDGMKQRIRARVLRLAQSADGKGFQVAQRELKRLRQSVERVKELYVDGTISKAEYYRRRDELQAQLADSEMKMERASPDLRNLEQTLDRLDQIIELIKEGTPEQQREAIDALIKREEEKDGILMRVVPRSWARGVFPDLNS